MHQSVQLILEFGNRLPPTATRRSAKRFCRLYCHFLPHSPAHLTQTTTEIMKEAEEEEEEEEECALPRVRTEQRNSTPGRGKHRRNTWPLITGLAPTHTQHTG